MQCGARGFVWGAGARPPCDVGLSFTGILGRGEVLVWDGGGGERGARRCWRVLEGGLGAKQRGLRRLTGLGFGGWRSVGDARGGLGS
jgi:hypothetical protein